MPTDLWRTEQPAAWHDALAKYDKVIAAQGVASLVAHDTWYQYEFPVNMTSRAPSYVTHDEIVRVTEWKMARGVWRARNLALVRDNAAAVVEQTTREALALIPRNGTTPDGPDELPWTPISRIAELSGVGPATASAVIAAFAPVHYPFFDELVAAQVPDLGPTKFSLPYYRKYAVALRSRARELGDDWTPARVERALWAHVGGKSGADE